MPILIEQNSPGLHIELDDEKTQFYPGDTISGVVVRQAFAKDSDCHIVVSLHGRTLCSLEENSSGIRKICKIHTLIDGEKCSKTLSKGALDSDQLASGKQESWPFDLTIPKDGIDTNLLPNNPKHKDNEGWGRWPTTLPPSFYLADSLGKREALVEYFIQANVEPQDRRISNELVALLPIQIKARSSSPLFDLSEHEYYEKGTMKSWSSGLFAASERLDPSFQDAPPSLSQKIGRFLRPPSVPEFHFRLNWTCERALAPDLTEPISFCVSIKEDWRTTPSIRRVRPRVVLTDFSFTLEASICINCEFQQPRCIECERSTTILLRCSKCACLASLVASGYLWTVTDNALTAREPRSSIAGKIEIPYESLGGYGPMVDVGKAVGLYLDTLNSYYFPFPQFNISVWHTLRFAFELEIGGELVKGEISPSIRILPCKMPDKDSEKETYDM